MCNVLKEEIRKIFNGSEVSFVKSNDNQDHLYIKVKGGSVDEVFLFMKGGQVHIGVPILHLGSDEFNNSYKKLSSSLVIHHKTILELFGKIVVTKDYGGMENEYNEFVNFLSNVIGHPINISISKDRPYRMDVRDGYSGNLLFNIDIDYHSVSIENNNTDILSLDTIDNIGSWMNRDESKHIEIMDIFKHIIINDDNLSSTEADDMCNEILEVYVDDMSIDLYEGWDDE